MGSHHLRILEGLKDVELVGVVDPDPARADRASMLFGCDIFPDVEAIAGDIDAASVAAPSSAHAEVAGLLLERGVHCLVEKPLANTESDCITLIEAARERELVLMVGHVERFNPMVQQLGRVLAQSQIHAFDARRMSSLSSRITDVDVVLDLMVHDIDVILSLSRADVSNVFAHGIRTTGSAADYVSALLTFDDGGIATLAASRITHNKIRELQITTDQAFIQADYATQELHILRQAQTSALDGPDDEAGYALDLAIERVHVRPAEPLVQEIQHFVNAVRGLAVPKPSGEDALRALRLVWEIQQQLGPRAETLRG